MLPAWLEPCKRDDVKTVRELLAAKAFSFDETWSGRPLSSVGFGGRATPLGIAIGLVSRLKSLFFVFSSFYSRSRLLRSCLFVAPVGCSLQRSVC
jgi:hypothetical protein